MIVADTNMILYLTGPGPNRRVAREVRRIDREWFSPPLWRSEFRNALFGELRRNDMTLRRANQLFGIAAEVIDQRELGVDARSVLALAVSTLISAYDAEFVALAMALEVRLITMDAKLLRAVPDVAMHPETFVEQRG